MNQNYAGYGGQQGITQQQQQQQQIQPNIMSQQQNMFQSQQQMMAPQNQQMINTQSQQMLNAQRNQAEYMQQRMQPAVRPPYIQVQSLFKISLYSSKIICLSNIFFRRQM